MKMNNNSKKSRVAESSVASNITLVVFRLIVGVYSGAVSVASENRSNDSPQTLS